MIRRVLFPLLTLAACWLPAVAAAATEGGAAAGPAPLLPATLEAAWAQLQTLPQAAVPADLPRLGRLLGFLAAGAGIGLLLGVALRRAMGRISRGEDTTAPGRWRALGRALAQALQQRAFSLALPAGLIAVLEALDARAAAGGQLAATALVLWPAYRLGTALLPWLLAPFGGEGLLPRLRDPAVHRIWLGIRGLFALTLTVAFLALAADTLEVPGELRAVGTMAVTLAALPLLWLLRDRAGWRRLAGATTPAPLPPGGEGLLILWRLLAAVVALGLPLLAAAGHTRLAGDLLLNLLFSLLVMLGTGLLAAGLSRTLARLEQAAPPETLAPLVSASRLSNLVLVARAAVSAVVVLAGLVAVLALWRVPLAPVWGLVQPALFGFHIGGYELSLVGIAAGLLVMLAVLYLGRWIRRRLHHRLLPRFGMDEGKRNSIASLTYYVVLVLGALLAVSVAGFDLTNLAIIAGALSVGIGFGLQNVVNNFVSGLILLFERPIKIGDVVEYQGLWAEVEEIRVRSTIVRTYDRAELIVPNSDLVSTTVTNWTHSDYRIRIILKIGVAYGSDTAQVRDLLLQAATEHPHVEADPEPVVLFRDFGDSALLFELRCFTHLDYYLSAASDLRFRVDELFREHGITIPFPQRDVHFFPTEAAGTAADAE